MNRKRILMVLTILLLFGMLSTTQNLDTSYDGSSLVEQPNLYEDFINSAVTVNSLEDTEVISFSTPVGAVSGDVATSNTYDSSRTMIITTVSHTTISDDMEDTWFLVEFVNSTCINWTRRDNDFVVVLDIQLIEFSVDTGVETYIIKGLDPAVVGPQYAPIGGTIPYGEYFTLNCGIDDQANSNLRNTGFSKPHNNTHIWFDMAQPNYGLDYADPTYNIQVIYVPDSSVQIFDVSLTSTSVSQTISSVDTSRSILVGQAYDNQVASHTARTQSTGGTLEFTTSTNVEIVRAVDTTATDYVFLQVIEWPDWVTVQQIDETGMDAADTTEIEAISEVSSVDDCLVLSQGYWSASSGHGGVHNGGTDNTESLQTRHYLTSTIELTSVRGAHTSLTIDYIIAIMEFGDLPNTAPVNDQAPTLDNPSDTDNLYAQYVKYQITVYVSDVDGFADINYLEIGLWDNTQTTEYWRGRYDEDTDTFSEQYDGGTYVELDVGSSSATESGNDIDATFYITIDWDFPDAADIDTKCYVIDTATDTDTDWYEVDWDVETRLDISGIVTNDNIGTPNRGMFDYGYDVDINGTVIYYGGTVNPPSGEVDAVIDATSGSYPDWWGQDTSLSSGYFKVGLRSSNSPYDGYGNIANADNYTLRVKIVAEGGGQGGADLCESAHYTYYIYDGIYAAWNTGNNFAAFGTSMNTTEMIGIGTASNVTLQLYYAFDGSGVTDGAFYISDYQTPNIVIGSGEPVTYSGVAGIYLFQVIKSSTVGILYGQWIVDNGGQIVQFVAAAGGVWNDTHGCKVEWNTTVAACRILWDRVIITHSVVGDISIPISHSSTITTSARWESNSSNIFDKSGSITNNFTSPVTYDTDGIRYFTTTSVSETITDITQFSTNTVSVAWNDVAITAGPAYYWTQYSPEAVWLIWGVGTTFEWSSSGNPIVVSENIELHFYINGTINAKTVIISSAITGVAIGPFDISWYYTNISIQANDGTMNSEIWQNILEVDILHSLQLVNFDITPTDDYFWITYQTNLLNGTIAIWDDAIDSGTLFGDNIYYSAFEGMHQIPRSTIIGTHNITICITSTGVQYDKDFTDHDYVWWYNFTYIVSEPTSYDCHIVILNNLYKPIPFSTFEVYVNTSRVYHDIIQVVNGYDYNITVKNRFGDTVNSTIFSADFEMVIFVNTYSFKFMNWYQGFLRVNVTRAGVTYSEIIMPTEILEFNLFEATYIFTVDFLNGTTKFSQEIYVQNSTGYVITGDSLTDVFNLVNSLYDMTTEINITVTSTNNYALTISIDLTNINATINEQLIQVLLNITNTNSTIYDQAIDLLAYLQNVNSTLYNQAVDIIIELNYISSNITAGFISVSATLSAMDSNLYSNFTSIYASLILIDSNLLSNFTEVTATLSAIGSNITSNYLSLTATLLAMDSSLLSNFTSISASLVLINSNLLSNFTEVTATLSAIGSNITSNYLSLTATLLAMDSSLLSNFTSISASLILIDSNLFSNFTEVTATLSAIGSNITSNYLSVSATLLAMNSTLYSNFTSIVASLILIDSNLLSNFTEVTATLSAIGSNITSNYLSLAATLLAMDSSLLSNFTSISASLILIDSNLFSNFTSITSTLSAIGSNITAQTITLLAEINSINSNITAQTVTLLASIVNVNSTIYNQTVTILTRILNINSTIYEQGVDILTYIYNTNSTLYAQTIRMLLEVDNVEELATSIKGLAETIKGEVADAPTPVNLDAVFNLMFIAVLVFVLILIIVWGLRAILRDKKEGKVASDSQLDSDIELEGDVKYK